jgi:ATP-dependent Zn protease
MQTFYSILSAIVFILGTSTTLPGAEPDYLPYEEFIVAVEAGSVKTVSLDRFSQITGTYTVGGAERPFRSYGDTGSANDVLLNRLLKQKNVAITLKPQQDRNPFFEAGFVAILMLFVPLLTLLLAFRINSKLNRLSQMSRTEMQI